MLTQHRALMIIVLQKMLPKIFEFQAKHGVAKHARKHTIALPFVGLKSSKVEGFYCFEQTLALETTYTP